MATTTPNYGWPVPTSTDYVKDGATAIEALGDAIDATVFGLGSGLTLVKTQTIGSAVSSFTVTGAFSATYDNYYVSITGGTGSTTNRLLMTLGASSAGYYYAGQSMSWTGTATTRNGNNVASFEYAGTQNTVGINCQINFLKPFLAEKTSVWNTFNYLETGNGAAYIGGYHDSAVSYSAFTITCLSGTLTGGTVRVYGYQNS